MNTNTTYHDSWSAGATSWHGWLFPCAYILRRISASTIFIDSRTPCAFLTHQCVQIEEATICKCVIRCFSFGLRSLSLKATVPKEFMQVLASSTGACQSPWELDEGVEKGRCDKPGRTLQWIAYWRVAACRSYCMLYIAKMLQPFAPLCSTCVLLTARPIISPPVAFAFWFSCIMQFLLSF